MFDSTTNKFNYNINAVSGTLRKSHPKSKMTVRKVSDSVCVFNAKKPRLFNYDDAEIVILQVMLIGDDKAIVEYVNKKDFEEVFNGYVDKETISKLKC